MKTRNRSLSVRLVTLVLAVLLLLPALFSCASKGKTLLTMDHEGTKVTFSVNLYEFMLSRMKGSLVYNRYTVNGMYATEDGFWDYKSLFNGTDLQTLNEYYGDLILENCYTYTTVLWYFESMDLSLTDEQLASVEERLQDILENYADGSKTKLNSILKSFGINYSLLREAFLLEEKVKSVQNALYGADATMLGVEVKDAFLKDNYVHVKQIFIPFSYVIYETDKNGDEIYYVKESQTKSICYDTKNGFLKTDANNIPETDANGDDIYYTSKEYTRIAYDQENGVRSYVLDKNGVAKTKEMTKEEIDATVKRAEDLYASLAGCTPAEFEAAMEKNNQRDIDGSYDPLQYEYYLQKGINYAAADAQFSYLSDMVDAVDAMEVEDVTSISSDSSGYHIVMKYAPVEKAYEDVNFKTWFSSFNSSLIERVFLDECHKLFPHVKLNEKILASATDIKRIGANENF